MAQANIVVHVRVRGIWRVRLVVWFAPFIAAYDTNLVRVLLDRALNAMTCQYRVGRTRWSVPFKTVSMAE